MVVVVNVANLGWNVIKSLNGIYFWNWNINVRGVCSQVKESIAEKNYLIRPF